MKELNNTVEKSKYEQLLDKIEELKSQPISLITEENSNEDSSHPFFGLTKRQKQEILFRILRISQDEEFNDDDFLMEIDGQKCFSRGNIGIIKAKAKHGKTQAVAAMVSALMRGKLWKMKSTHQDCKVIVFDTEQARRDTHNLYTRIVKMSGCMEENIKKRLAVLSLRSLTFEQRMDIIKYAVAEKRPDIIFIDGYVDLLDNFNDQTQSMALVNQLMKLTNEYHCYIMGVIHTNPNDGEGKSRGHLGTILEQKASDVFQMKKENGVFSVTTSMTRGIPIPKWSFRFAEDGLLESADCQPNTKDAMLEYITSLLQEAPNGQLPKTFIRDKVMEKFQLQSSAAYNRIKAVQESFLVTADAAGKETLSIKDIEAATDNSNQICLFIYGIRDTQCNL